MLDGRSIVDIIRETRPADQAGLPACRRTLEKIRSLVLQPDSWLEELAPILAEDPVLALEILRLANSSLYRGLRQVATTQEALVRLGQSQTDHLLRQAAQTREGFRHPLVDSYLSILRRHSLAVACAARWLAERTGFRSLSQEAFLAGLLHDIGKFWLLQALDEIAEPSRYGLTLSETLVREVLDGLHIDQGCQLMESWNLPQLYQEIAGKHHEEDCDGKDVVLCLVRLANMACQKLGLASRHLPELVLAATPEAQHLRAGEVLLAELEIMLEDNFLTPPAPAVHPLPNFP